MKWVIAWSGSARWLMRSLPVLKASSIECGGRMMWKPFGNLKANHGITRFALRGLKKVDIEVGQALLAHPLRKWATRLIKAHYRLLLPTWSSPRSAPHAGHPIPGVKAT
jgi:hypothetical protein